MIVVVEGRTDAAFSQHVVDRLYSGRVDLEPREAQGKYDIPKVAAGLLQANVRELAVAQDIDGQDPEMMMTSFDQAVHSALGISPAGQFFIATDCCHRGQQNSYHPNGFA